MKLNTVRARLTLWNVAVLALVLAGFGLALVWHVRSTQAAMIDESLVRRGRDLARQPIPGMGAAFGVPGPDPNGRWRGGGMAGFPGAPPARRPFPPGEAPFPGGRFDRAAALRLDGEPFLPGAPARAWDAEGVRAAAAGQERFATLERPEGALRVFSTPLWRFGRPEGAIPDGVIQVVEDLAGAERLNSGLTRSLLTLIPMALIVAALGGTFLTERALRPVRDITRTAAGIGAEDLSRRLEVSGEDELAGLAATFNEMIARLESAFERQRQFTGDASHELRTPLTIIKANTSLALAAPRTPVEYREALRAADEAADAMSRIVQDLLLLARSDARQVDLEIGPIPIRELLERAVRSAAITGGPGVTILSEGAPAFVDGDAHYLERLLANLLENALRHTPPDGRVTLFAGGASGEVLLAVSDTGEGIAPEHLPHVCDRFYRVDGARAHTALPGPGEGNGTGTGLGLAICSSIVQAHGGVLNIESEPGRGTTVTVTLPESVRALPPATPAGHGPAPVS